MESGRGERPSSQLSGIAGFWLLGPQKDTTRLAGSLKAYLARPCRIMEFFAPSIWMVHWDAHKAEHDTQRISGSTMLVTAQGRIEFSSDHHTPDDYGANAVEELRKAHYVKKAYRRWGASFGDHLDGEFSIAIYDNERDEVVLVRDRIGVGQLFYSYSPGQYLAYSSDLELLLELPVPRRVCKRAIARHLIGRFGSVDETSFEDVRRVLPAHHATFTRENTYSSPYWDLTRARDVRFSHDSEYVEALREQVQRSVRSRIPASHTGCMLSGGLDSSTIANVASEALSETGERLSTYSIFFPSSATSDESALVRLIVDRLGVEAHCINGESSDPLDIGWCPGEPQQAPNLFLNRLACQEASRRGTTHLLDGFGGDQCIADGRARLTESVSQRKLHTLAIESFFLLCRGSISVRTLLRQAFVPLLPPQLAAIDSARGRFRSTFEAATLLNPALIGATKDEFLDGMFGFRVPRTVREAHVAGLQTGIESVAAGLLTKTGSISGLRICLPFLDSRLWEFAVGLPSRMKLRRGWQRYVLRAAGVGRVPAEVIWRANKTSVSQQFHRAFRRWSMTAFCQLALQPPDHLGEFVMLGSLGPLANRAKSGDHRASAACFRVLTLHNWLKRWFA